MSMCLVPSNCWILCSCQPSSNFAAVLAARENCSRMRSLADHQSCSAGSCAGGLQSALAGDVDGSDERQTILRTFYILAGLERVKRPQAHAIESD